MTDFLPLTGAVCDKGLEQPIGLDVLSLGMPLNSDEKPAVQVFDGLDYPVQAHRGNPVRRHYILDGLMVGGTDGDAGIGRQRGQSCAW
jgi:hypothetical protein